MAIRRSVVIPLLFVLAILVTPRVAESQSPAPRIGLLGPADGPRFSEIALGLKRGLREQGYREDTIHIVEGRTRRADEADARATVQALVGQRVTVLFVIGSALARLARETAPQLPIVFITPGDPVAAGLVMSFAHPGRNMTAMMFEYPELSGKRLELLRELAPRVVRVLVLYDSRDASPRQGVTAARAAATALGITLIEREVKNAEEIHPRLEESGGGRCAARHPRWSHLWPLREDDRGRKLEAASQCLPRVRAEHPRRVADV
jgi:putative ABC transport system substrate-binding protein